MNEFAIFTGFVRHIPDVCAFATPIFLAANAKHVIQAEERNSGLVERFDEVHVGDGYFPVNSRIVVRLGDPILYAFETNTHMLAVGSARMLHEHLISALSESPGFREIARNTAAAIDSLLDSGGYRQSIDNSDVLYFFNKPSSNQHHTHISSQYPTPKKPQYRRVDWFETLSELLGSEHDRQLSAHDYTQQRIEQLIANSLKPDEDIEAMHRALDGLIKESGRLTLGGTCLTCIKNIRDRIGEPRKNKREPLVAISSYKGLTDLAGHIEANLVEMNIVNEASAATIAEIIKVARHGAGLQSSRGK